MERFAPYFILILLALLKPTGLVGQDLPSHAVVGAKAADRLEVNSPRITPLRLAVRRVRPSAVSLRFQNSKGDSDHKGSGFIIDERGYIITNEHLTAHGGKLTVRLADGKLLTGRIVNEDKAHDLALVKVDSVKPLPVMPWGTSSDIEPGEEVFAIGNPLGYPDTVTRGIISNRSRDIIAGNNSEYKGLFQTDTSINLGNSGGPLVNLEGELIGINVAVRENANGIAFAIPIDDARPFFARLFNSKRPGETYHGLESAVQGKARESKLVVQATEAGSPTAEAGFHAGDIIAAVGSLKIHDQTDWERALIEVKAGEHVSVTVERSDGVSILALKVRRYAAPEKISPKQNAPVLVSQRETQPQGSRTWIRFGAKLERVPPSQLKEFNEKYHGGMRLVDLHEGGPAETAGLRKGDILLGLGDWETAAEKDIEWILTHATVPPTNKFLILRNGQRLEGNVTLSPMPSSP